MAIGFFENPKDFELTNDVFGKDTLFSQNAVVRLLLVGKPLTTPALMRGAVVSVKFGNPLKTAVREEFSVFL